MQRMAGRSPRSPLSTPGEQGERGKRLSDLTLSTAQIWRLSLLKDGEEGDNGIFPFSKTL